jgi:predicted ArsR family transcriptional regulator
MSSKTAILTYLSKGKTLSTKQARTLFKIKNVAARIHDLRNDGQPIVTHAKQTTGRGSAVYQLA